LNVKTDTIAPLLEVDASAYTASFGGEEVILSATEIEILTALIANSSKVCSRQELAETVGRQERTIDVVISGLRQKIGRDFVRNVRGRGWIINKRLLMT
jgi:two-component system, OmpR family, response regulator